MPMPPLTFFKAKKINSIRYPYGIQTNQHPTNKFTHKQATDKGSGTTKAENQPKVTRDYCGVDLK